MDLQASQPAYDRPIHVGGLMICCLRKIRTTRLMTEPGGRMRCDVCHTTLVVDDTGWWLWGPAQNLILAQARRD